MTSAALNVRPARASDRAAVVEIYNHYILNTAITFDIEPYTVASRASWFDQFGDVGRHRLLVAERAGAVIGYAATLPFRPKAAYETSVEVSIYVDHRAARGRVGTALYTALFEAVAGEDIHRAIAGITLPNEGSMVLHRYFGFREVGVMSEVGRKHDRYWDVLWMEKRL